MLCQDIITRLCRVRLARRTQITLNASLINYDFAIIYNYFNDIKKRYQTYLYQDVKDPERGHDLSVLNGSSSHANDGCIDDGDDDDDDDDDDEHTHSAST